MCFFFLMSGLGTRLILAPGGGPPLVYRHMIFIAVHVLSKRLSKLEFMILILDSAAMRASKFGMSVQLDFCHS